ncbi:hypothetical protein B0H11DRAFT_2258528 [Mycena galericulata]|nr:hypothetical protein B0H11DRAFT_2258528 [Mycena galericulata]
MDGVACASVRDSYGLSYALNLDAYASASVAPVHALAVRRPFYDMGVLLCAGPLMHVGNPDAHTAPFVYPFSCLVHPNLDADSLPPQTPITDAYPFAQMAAQHAPPPQLPSTLTPFNFQHSRAPRAELHGQDRYPEKVLSSIDKITADRYLLSERALALEFPLLWTSIVVCANRRREQYLLDTQLARSGNAPLDLLIKFTSSVRRSDRNSDFDALMKKIVEHCGRWSTIQLEFDGCCIPHCAFHALGAMPLLKELVFSGSSVSHLAKFDCFKNASNLRRVVLGDPGETSIRGLRLPWAKITTYKAKYPCGSTHFQNLFETRISSSAISTSEHVPETTSYDSARHPVSNRPRYRFYGPSPSTNALFSALTFRPDAENICPSLTSLSWGDCFDTMDPVAFLQMVQSRWRISNPLYSRVRFVRVYVSHLKIPPHLGRLVEDGMDILALSPRKGNPEMQRWREY